MRRSEGHEKVDSMLGMAEGRISWRMRKAEGARKKVQQRARCRERIENIKAKMQARRRRREGESADERKL